MREFAVRFAVVAGILLLSFRVSGQSRVGAEINPPADSNSAQSRLGYPQDWSSLHLLMPGANSENVLAAGVHDPRHVYNYVMRQVAMENFRTVNRVLPHRRRIKIDWSVSLENGYVPPNQFPAKYRFDIKSSNCNSDYALFGLTVTTGAQANVVGINNLYTEAIPACNNGSPWVAFAYNTVSHTGGQIKTSPVLSVDGTKVAFVESTSTASYFHVLVLPFPIPTPPSQTGTVLSPQTPTSCSLPTTPGCMTTLTIENTATNSNSSPWIDYSADTAYVGADDGLLYKIAPVFGGGAPALVSNLDWPVTVSIQSNKALTAPVVDTGSGRIFIGDGQGYLYGVALTHPAHAYGAQQTIGWAGHGPGTGIVDPPMVIVDSAHPSTNQVFVSTGCSNVLGIGGAVSQISSNFTNSSAFATVDLGSGSGNGDCTTGDVHQGTFDNAFWLHGLTSGHMIACGFVQGSASKPLIPSNPQLYMFPFDTNNLITSLSLSNVLLSPTAGQECSPLTEFYNGITDHVFYGVGNSSGGHIESSIITSLLSIPTCLLGATSTCVQTPSALGGTSGIIVDNQLANGGSNIYFSTLARGSVNNQNCSVSGGAPNPYCAVKLNQSALQ